MLTDDQIEAAEQTIRDMAATVRNAVTTRKEHPTYGYSKANINQKLTSMEGAIGLYMVLTGQATHATVSGLVIFRDNRTLDAVLGARQAVQEM